jgi:hypothetical protein
MATANIQSDAGDDFVTCGVCFNEYHEETKKPKSLPCSHTICLSCLRVMRYLCDYYSLSKFEMIIIYINYLTFYRKYLRMVPFHAPFAATYPITQVWN